MQFNQHRQNEKKTKKKKKTNHICLDTFDFSLAKTFPSHSSSASLTVTASHFWHNFVSIKSRLGASIFGLQAASEAISHLTNAALVNTDFST